MERTIETNEIRELTAAELDAVEGGVLLMLEVTVFATVFCSAVAADAIYKMLK